MKLTRTSAAEFLWIISHNPNQFMLIDLIQQADKLLFEGHAIVGSRHASTATYRRIRRTVIHMTENFSKNPPVNCR